MIRIGVLGTANIAKNKMIPAIKASKNVEYAGVAVASVEEYGDDPECRGSVDAYKARKDRAEGFVSLFGGKAYTSFKDMLEDDKTDAVYIPLPPSLHFKWAARALECGKHVLLEKPFTTSLSDTEGLLRIAEEKKLAVIEDYGFVYHDQFTKIRELIDSGAVGDIRLIRTAFGFPHRSDGDFRYSKALGGGALLDCGGYTLKLATRFLGPNPEIKDPRLFVTSGHEVDVYGCGTVTDGTTVVQVAFGMDMAYKCELEIWGSRGTIFTSRIYTAPADLETDIVLNNTEGMQHISIPGTDQFLKIVEQLSKAVGSADVAGQIRDEIRTQAGLVEDFGSFAV